MRRKPKAKKPDALLVGMFMALIVTSFFLTMGILEERFEIGTLHLQVQLQRETLDQIGYKAAGFPGEKP